jgi:hypothetical protein
LLHLREVNVIKRIGKSSWGIYSRDGKLLEKRETRRGAEKRLAQIEFFANTDKGNKSK